MGNRSTIHPTLLYDDDRAVLVDVGMPGHMDAIRSSREKAGVPFQKVAAVILTHQDIDHIGSIQDVLNAIGKPIDVYAHAEEKPYIEGEKKLIKLNEGRLAQMLAQMPEDGRRKLEAIFLNPPAAKVTRVVNDGEVLPFFGGIQVIFTPGQTPGHISLYYIPSKTLIAGDTTVCQDGKILGPNPQATLDMSAALESQKKFTLLDIQRVICYHGGLCDDQVNEQFRELFK